MKKKIKKERQNKCNCETNKELFVLLQIIATRLDTIIGLMRDFKTPTFPKIDEDGSSTIKYPISPTFDEKTLF